jgi:predicted ester cyclase
MKNTTALALAAVLAVPALADAPKESARKTIDRFFAIVDAKAVARLAEVETPDIDMRTPQGASVGIAAHAQSIQGFAMALPNFAHTIERCVEQGAWIACEGTFRGDHKGPLHMPDGSQVPATGKHVEFPFTAIARVQDAKVASFHVYFDPTAMMRQLGLMPSPPSRG